MQQAPKSKVSSLVVFFAAGFTGIQTDRHILHFNAKRRQPKHLRWWRASDRIGSLHISCQRCLDKRRVHNIWKVKCFVRPPKEKLPRIWQFQVKLIFWGFQRILLLLGKISNLAEMFQVSQQFAIYLSLSGLIGNPRVLENPIEIITRCPTTPGSSLVNFTLKPNGSLSWILPKMVSKIQTLEEDLI